MARHYWKGLIDSDPDTLPNWVTSSDGSTTSAALPTNNDDIVFDSTSDGLGNHIQFQGTFPTSGNLNSLVIGPDFTKLIQTGASSTINLKGEMGINKTGCLKPTHALIFDFNTAPSTTVYDGGGSSYAVKPFVLFYSGMTASAFDNESARALTTFNFAAENFTMIDGIYPNITFTGFLYAKRIYSDASRTEFNAYGSVDMLNFNGGQITSEDFDIYDYDKQFYFEKDLISIGESFKFGHTTARFKTYKASGTGAVVFPATGELNSAAFGNDTTNNFYTQYHKVVIENNDDSANYWLVSAGRIIECNELVVNDGGRFYGPSSGTKAVAIRSVKRPTVQGDWNFRQTADGIYESIGDSSNTPVFHGGTGLQTIANGSILYGNGNGSIGVLDIGTTGQILKVVSGLPSWEDA
jgi:hypothetical protein